MRVKAAFIYNFLGFVEWPYFKQSTSINVCALGESDPVIPYLENILTKATIDQPVDFHRVDKDSRISDCHILFISHTRKSDIEYMIGKINNHPVLTVSDAKSFASDLGGIVELTEKGGNVKIIINIRRAQQLNLTIDSELLELVSVIN